MRPLAAAAAIAACLLTLTATASAATLPPEGVFDNCSLETEMATCVQRLEVMRSGGMRVVVVPAGGSLTSMVAYAATANSLGMKVMWELSNPSWWQQPLSATSLDGVFSAVSALCGCQQNGGILAALVGLLGRLPGTYGYYAVDDTMIGPNDRAGVAAYVSQLKRADPNHLVMVGTGNYVEAGQYVRIADAIGTEVYPVTTGSLMPVSRHQISWVGVAQTAGDAQRAANRVGKASTFILQAFTWGDNLDDGQATGVCSPSETKWACYARLRYPSAAEQLELRNEVLEHASPKLILWWWFPGTYGQSGNDTYTIYPTGADAAARWSGLAAAVKAPYPSAATTRSARPARHARRHRRSHRRRRR